MRVRARRVADFGSIAQEHRGMQVMAISSLPVYSAYSDAFIVVAPKAKHAQTGLPCDLGSYATRGWVSDGAIRTRVQPLVGRF